MENLKLYAEHAVYVCFTKNPERTSDAGLIPRRADVIHFEVENFEQKDCFNSNAIFGRIVYEDEKGHKHDGDSIMIKMMAKWKMRSKFSDVMFSNEIYVYSRIIPFFATFNEKVLNLFPKFYYGDVTVSQGQRFDSDDVALIILENLMANGYCMTKSRIVLSIAELRLIVKKLAHFHAYSYYIKKKSPREFYSLVGNLVETHFVDTKLKSGYVNISSDHHIDVLSKDGKYAEKAEIIRDLLKDADEFLRNVFTTSREPMAVVCHGDFLRNNLMIKFNSNEYPVDVKFFDLACCRYCSPIVDLSLILYMNTDQKTRDLYWDELIDVYCSSLREPFPDNDQIPSREEVVQEFKINSLSAFLLTSFFIPDMMRCEEIPNFVYRDYFLPEFKEFRNTSWFEIPNYVIREVGKKLYKPHHEQAVVDVLKDIINRGYV